VSFRPGAVVNDVARRHGVAPQQLTQWRRAARDGLLALPGACGAQMAAFVPLQVSEPDAVTEKEPAQRVEIIAGDVVMLSPAAAGRLRATHCRDCQNAGGAPVIVPGQHIPIVIATCPVDFRRGHDGLAATVQNELGLDPYCGLI